MWCMTTKQRSRGGAAMFAYEMWKERNIHPRTCLHFVECIKQCIKCIGEKNNLKYRSYQSSIDPIPIPTLVSILSILGSIRPPLTHKSGERENLSSCGTPVSKAVNWLFYSLRMKWLFSLCESSMFLGAHVRFCARAKKIRVLGKRFPLAHHFKAGAICTNIYSIFTMLK